MAKKEKVSFLFYYDYLEQFKELTADEIIDMIKSIIEYEKEDIEPAYEDRTLRSVWNFIKRRLDLDKANYQKTCEKNKKIAEERWKRKILNEENTKSTTGTNGKKNVPLDTKNTDIDIDTHIDKDSFNCVYDNKEENLKEESKKIFCHLGRDSKIEACQNCLKNTKCPLKTDLQFQFQKGCSFEEWLAKKQALAEDVLNHDPPDKILEDMKELEDYNWFGDNDD